MTPAPQDSKFAYSVNKISKGKTMGGMSKSDDDDEDKEPSQLFVQWTTTDNKAFFPAARSVAALEPGLFEIRNTPNGIYYFERVAMGTEGLLKFPETASQMVVNEIETFWEREELFKKHNLAFKRGMILWGPPGSGKTCTIKLAIQDLIKRKGVVIKFGHPAIFAEGMRIFREIQPNTPVICLMEDIDAILESYNESDVINILDGVDMIQKVVFLATTNYPEKLGPRILNRPSRFDKRFKIGMPNPESRRIYLRSLITGKKDIPDLERWVKDTEGFSIAHLKELFIAVVFLGDGYDTALRTLKEMSDSISSEHDGSRMGLYLDDNVVEKSDVSKDYKKSSNKKHSGPVPSNPGRYR